MMRRISIGILSLALLAALSWAVLSLPAKPTGLTEASLARLSESGVTNPVTAVLLNYRGYDTLLEVGVLLLAIVGVWSLRRGEWPAADLRDRPLLLSLLRVVLPVLVLAAGYLLWIGALRARRSVSGRRFAGRRARAGDARRTGAARRESRPASCARASCWGCWSSPRFAPSRWG